MKKGEISYSRYAPMYMFTEERLELIRQAGREIAEAKEEIFELFYDSLRLHPTFSEDYNEIVIERFAQDQDGLWQYLLEVKIDDEFVQYRSQLVRDLLQIGLAFEACFTAIFALHEFIELKFMEYNLASLDLLQTFKRICSLGALIAIDTFNQEINQQLADQNEMLMQLSTPVTPIWEDILLLPIVGIVDSIRAQTIMSAVLQEIAERQAKVFILDISGVAIVDTAVANYFIRVSKAAWLMGCKTILSGISPAIAQTLVELGVDTGRLSTRSNMQDALERAFSWTGRAVLEKRKQKG